MSATIHALSHVTPHGRLAELLRRAALGCGVAASIVYVVAVLVAPTRWEGYDSVDQAVSELSAIGAPSRPLMLGLLIVDTALAALFAVGVLLSARGRSGVRRLGWLLAGIGAADIVGVSFPMHQRGAEASFTDTMHVVLTGITVVLILLAFGVGMFALGRGFRWYSLVTLVVALAFGLLSSALGGALADGEETPGLGLYERVNIGAYLLWMAVLAVVLLRERTDGPVGKGLRTLPARELSDDHRS
jgi:hypothetical protein